MRLALPVVTLLLTSCSIVSDAYLTTSWYGQPGRIHTADIPRLSNWTGTPFQVVDEREQPPDTLGFEKNASWESVSRQVTTETNRVLMEAIGAAREDRKPVCGFRPIMISQIGPS